jgi:hypothetical protein
VPGIAVGCNPGNGRNADGWELKVEGKHGLMAGFSRCVFQGKNASEYIKSVIKDIKSATEDTKPVTKDIKSVTDIM